MNQYFCHTSARWLPLACLWLCVGGCAPKPSPPVVPSQVQNGQLYVSGQSEFDGLFRELHALSQLLANAPEEERQIRKTFASALAIENGATRQVLAEQVAIKAAELSAKKLRIKLDIEGLDADDESDTMAQAKVIGTLDDDGQKFVESTTLATRQELRHTARLRRAQKRLEHLAQHASALDPWVDSTFGGLGATKLAEVRHNLNDARRQIPLLAVRAAELAEESRHTVQKLVNAMTTDASIGSGKEPPLIAPLEVPQPPKKPHPPVSNAPAKKPPTATKPADAGGADFEP
jgi:hypothetical protein